MSDSVDTKIFLSASVPLPSRDPVYFDTADVICIRDAIRALTMVVIEQQLQLVFGGHPAITPMIRLQIAQSSIPVGERFAMFQSRYFKHDFARDNIAFEHVILTDVMQNDRQASLQHMREIMLAQPFHMGIFIGGMEGVEEEYHMFQSLQPNTPAYPIASTGAAAVRIFNDNLNLQRKYPELLNELSYLTLMRDLINRS